MEEKQGTSYRGLKPLSTGIIIKGFRTATGMELNMASKSEPIEFRNYLVLAYGASVKGISVGDIIELNANTQTAQVGKLNTISPDAVGNLKKEISSTISKLHQEAKLLNNKTELNAQISKINSTNYYTEVYYYTEGHNIWSAYTPGSDAELDKLLPGLSEAMESLTTVKTKS